MSEAAQVEIFGPFYPSTGTARRHNYRARRYGCQGKLDLRDIELFRQTYGDTCLACGKPEATIDHVIPLSRGGRNDFSNLQALCGDCNSRKGNQVIDYRLYKAGNAAS